MLSVKNLVHSIVTEREIYQSDGKSPEYRLYYGNVFLSIVVDVVALVFGLDDELAVPAIQAFALTLIVNESLAEVGYSMLVRRVVFIVVVCGLKCVHMVSQECHFPCNRVVRLLSLD